MVKAHDTEGATISLRVTRGAVEEAKVARGSGFARECTVEDENSRVQCVPSVSCKQSETRIFAGIFFCGSDKRLGTQSGKGAVL